MKKVYLQPTMTVVKVQQRTALLLTSANTVSTNMTGDDAIDYGGGSNGPARARSYGGIDWDDWE
jgi:hypothetical protein